MVREGLAVQANKPSSLDYARAEPFLRRLKQYRKHMNSNQFAALRGQALHGDLEGANAGLEKIVRRLQRGDMG